MKILLLGILLLVSTISRAVPVNTYFVTDYATPQDAINAAQTAGGGLVRFPCGVTTVSSGLTVTARGVTLQGCGPQGSILQASFTSGDIIALGNTTTPFNPCGGVRDMSITSSVTRTSGYAITVAGCQQGVLDNLLIQTTGGGGIHFNTPLSAIFTVSSTQIFITGAFTAVQIDSGSDRFFNKLWIQGNFTAGSRGFELKSSAGDWFKDVEVVKFETAVELAPGSSQSVVYGNFDNVLADTNTLYGFNYAGTGSILGMSCVRCWASTNGWDNTAGTVTNLNGRGFHITNGKGLSFTDSRVFNNGGHGVEVGAVNDVAISGGIFSGNCIAGTCTNGLAHGIVLTGTSGFRITGVRSGQAAGKSNTQGFGVYVNTGCDNYVVSGNDTRLNLTGGIANVPGTSATRILSDNL